MSKASDQIKYLTATKLGSTKKKYCRFKKNNIRYIDYKDPEFLLTFVNEQGKILPRRLTGNSLSINEKLHKPLNVLDTCH